MNKKVNSTCPTSNIEPGNLRKDVGYVNHPTIIRKIVLKSSVSTVTTGTCSTNKRFIEACVRKATPVEKPKLFKGFTNWRGCGKINMGKREFIQHIYNTHNGIALPSSFINRPPWVDYIHFYTEEAEMYYRA